MEERSVGPGLGKDSVESGKLASIIGMFLVVLFMLLTYGLFGVFANMALTSSNALVYVAGFDRGVRRDGPGRTGGTTGWRFAALRRVADAGFPALAGRGTAATGRMRLYRRGCAAQRRVDGPGIG